VNAAPSLTLRPVMPEDEEFLVEVYASTRAHELAQIPWDEAQRNAFLKMQLKARDQSYLMYYPAIDDRVILLADEKIGRLILSRTDTEIRLVDITILPEFRKQGLGTSLIKDLFTEADETGKIVCLQVEKTNPQARALYERMGLTVKSENQTHFQMERESVSVKQS
jgi:ribosomal protein S18 acetylase RimI-like enzyme